MEKGLYACDEITGLITATALLRPTGITDLTASSVKKKMKAKGFAKGVNRDDVIRGAADFGVDLDEHIQFVIDAMKPIAGELGLEKGSGAVRSGREGGAMTEAEWRQRKCRCTCSASTRRRGTSEGGLFSVRVSAARWEQLAAERRAILRGGGGRPGTPRKTRSTRRGRTDLPG